MSSYSLSQIITYVCAICLMHSTLITLKTAAFYIYGHVIIVILSELRASRGALKIVVQRTYPRMPDYTSSIYVAYGSPCEAHNLYSDDCVHSN